MNNYPAPFFRSSSKAPLSCLIPEKGSGPRTLYAMDVNGALHHIDDIETSTPGLVCPDCKGRLVARHSKKAGRNYSDHFAHHNTKECKTAGETALHLIGKEIFNQIQQFTLPEFEIEIPEMVHEDFCEIYQEEIEDYSEKIHKVWIKDKGWVDTFIYDQKEGTRKEFVIQSVDLEVYDNGIRPDLILTDMKGKKLYVEICVTHKVDERKENLLIKRNQPTIEIDLSGEERDISLSNLKELIKLGNRSHWIFHEFIYQEKQRLINNQKNKINTQKDKRTKETNFVRSWAQKAVHRFQNPTNQKSLPPQKRKHAVEQTLVNLGFDPVDELQLSKNATNSNSPFATDELTVFHHYFELTVYESLIKANKILQTQRLAEVDNKLRYVQKPVCFDFRTICIEMQKRKIIKHDLLTAQKEQLIFSKRIDPNFCTGIDIFETWLRKLEGKQIIQTIKLPGHKTRKTLHSEKIRIRAQNYGVEL